MTMWPQFRLTAYESQWCEKYDSPETPQKGVLRRIYSGRLDLSAIVRRPTLYYQISRRARVFAATVSGDVEHFNIEMKSATGEQYTPDPVPLVTLFPGSNNDPRTTSYSLPVLDDTEALATYSPHIIEPNIVLLPNQVLIVTGTPIVPEDTDNEYRVWFNMHVVEFPDMYTPY